ncbi:MAG: hypothetical protein AAFO74_16925 [Pseudomonadota bacterium]
MRLRSKLSAILTVLAMLTLPAFAQETGNEKNLLETELWHTSTSVERDPVTRELIVTVRPRHCLSVSVPIMGDNIDVELVNKEFTIYDYEPNVIKVSGGYMIPAGIEIVAKQCRSRERMVREGLIREFRIPNTMPLRYIVVNDRAQPYRSKPVFRGKWHGPQYADFSQQVPSASREDCLRLSPKPQTEREPLALEGLWRDMRDPNINYRLHGSGTAGINWFGVHPQGISGGEVPILEEPIAANIFQLSGTGRVEFVTSHCALVDNGNSGHRSLLLKARE